MKQTTPENPERSQPVLSEEDEAERARIEASLTRQMFASAAASGQSLEKAFAMRVVTSEELDEILDAISKGTELPEKYRFLKH